MGSFVIISIIIQKSYILCKKLDMKGKSYIMNKVVVFMNNAIMIPVLPCVINIFIKLICNSPLGWEYLDKGTLLFSISLYFLTCFKGSLGINDSNVSKGCSAIYITLFILSIVLFSTGIIFDTIYDIDISNYIVSVSGKINDQASTQITSFSPRFNNALSIGLCTLLFSLVTVIFSEYIRYRYKIEGEII